MPEFNLRKDETQMSPKPAGEFKGFRAAFWDGKSFLFEKKENGEIF